MARKAAVTNTILAGADPYAPLKIRANAGQFREALKTAAAATHQHVVHNVMAMVHLDATADGTWLRAFSGDTGLIVPLPAEVDAPGTCLLRPDKWAELLRSAGKGVVQLERRNVFPEPILEARIGDRNTFSLADAPWSAFPAMPAWDATDYHSVPAADLATALASVLPALDEDTAKYALASVRIEDGATVANFSVQRDGLRFVGCDGHAIHLSACPGTLMGEPAIPVGASQSLLPGRAAHILRQLAAADPGVTIDVAIGNDAAWFRSSAGPVLWCRLAEGRFPSWREVFPTDEPRARLEFGDHDTFARAIDQAAITATADNMGLVLECTPDLIVLHNESPDSGRSYVEATDYRFTGLPTWAVLDHRLMRAAIGAVPDGAEWTLTLRSDQEYAKQAVEILSDRFRAVIMPLEGGRAKPRLIVAKVDREPEMEAVA